MLRNVFKRVRPKLVEGLPVLIVALGWSIGTIANYKIWNNDGRSH